MFRATVLLTASRLVVLGLSFLQLLVLARKYGAGPESDAYFLASSVFFVLVTGMEGTLSAAFVPTFIELREKEGEAAAWALAGSLFQVLLAGALLLAVPFYAAVSPISFVLAPGSSMTLRSLCGEILRVLTPLIILLPLNALLSSIYYSYGRFAFAAATATLPLIGSVTSLVLLSDRFGVAALPMGMVALSIVQLLLLTVGLRGRVAHLFAFQRKHSPSLRRVARLAPPRFLGFSLMRTDLMIDRAFASTLGEGVVTAISYGGKIPSLTASLLSSPMMKSLIPFVSTLTARGDTKSLARLMSSAIHALAVVLIPMTVFAVLFSHEIVAILFQRGAFTAQATDLTAYALRLYTVGLFFFGLNPLLRGVFFAFQDTVTPLKVGAVSTALNIVLNFVLIRLLAHGGIALGTSLAAAFSCAALLALAKRKVPTLRFAELGRGLLRPLAAALAMAAVLRLGVVAVASSWRWDGVPSLTAHLLAGTLLYAVFCLLFRVNLRVVDRDPNVV